MTMIFMNTGNNSGHPEYPILPQFMFLKNLEPFIQPNTTYVMVYFSLIHSAPDVV